MEVPELTREVQEARDAFEDILAKNPWSFKACLKMHYRWIGTGRGRSMMSRLEVALSVPEDENKAKEARDVRLIMAQMQFLHENVEAL